MLRRIRWVRVVLTALLLEVFLLAIAIPLNLSANGRAILLEIVIPMCVVGAYAAGWWAAQKAGELLRRTSAKLA